ncbi:MAG: GNAT family N-acetyltransferase [Candidatus Hydrogenedentes bacterium]|nr:GNAT family N-acetyltransferase [Candidatus Hydrogenedentota bacterium]
MAKGPAEPGRLELVAPAERFETEFWAMWDEYVEAGERYEPRSLLPPTKDFPAYLHRLARTAQGTGRLPSRVPMSVLWLVRDESAIVGTCYLRWQLTPALKHEGGHVGYKIRPSQRRRGYGTRILALALEELREKGIRRVLVTCNSDNSPSARIIEKNGGQLENRVISRISGKDVSRYWIDL